MNIVDNSVCQEFQKDGAGVVGKRPARPYQTCIDKMCADGKIHLTRYDTWLKYQKMPLGPSEKKMTYQQFLRAKSIFAYELYAQLREHIKVCPDCRESRLIISK